MCARAPALGCPAPGPASSSLLWPSTESLHPLQKFNKIFSKRKKYFFYLLSMRLFFLSPPARTSSWTAGAECRMNSSGALLLFIEKMSDLTTQLSFEAQSTQQFLFMTSCIVNTCD